MKTFLLAFLFISTTAFAQSPGHGETEHNCDEPCLKCGHKEECKNTKAEDTKRNVKDNKQVPTVKEEDHSNHKHGSSQQ